MLKAELHCHLEGAAHPALVSRLAKKYDIDLSEILKAGAYVWNDFTSFLNAYDRASSVFRTAEDYRLLTYDHYSRLAEQGAIYGEVFASPDHAGLQGIDYTTLIEAISAGIDDANKEYGIEGRILVTCIRHLGPNAAEAVADKTAKNPHPKVTGFGMAGDERAFAVSDFSDTFEIAADAGLGLTAHAGELCGADSVKEAMDLLNVSRIGHGVRAIDDPVLVEQLAEHDIVLEVCVGSNLALALYESPELHPLSKLYDAGVRLTLNSDDPPFFKTTLANEYDLAEKHFHFTEAMLRECTRTAIEAAFVDESTRTRLLERLDE